MGERQICRSAEFRAFVSYNPFPDAFLYRVGSGRTAGAFAFHFVIQSRTLSGDERVPVFVLPDLLSDAPHLENGIILIIGCARLARVLFLVPIEERVILRWQLLPMWRHLALPIGMEVITGTKEPVGAYSDLREHPVPRGIRREAGHVMKIDMSLQTSP